MSISPCLVLAFAAEVCGCASRPEVSGHACVVLDIRNTDLCAAKQVVDGLSVVETTTGRHTTTDATGNFSVPIPDHATSAVLRVAEGAENRRISVVGVPRAPADDVLVPIITVDLWNTYLTALHVPEEDPTRAAVHVSFPFPGETIASAAVAGATSLIFCQGQPFEWGPQPPGDQTIAFMAFGVPVDAGTATITVRARTDEVIFSGDVPVQAGATTWLYLEP
ncbi:MAG TPA: hypothetical protein VFT22_07930 [Kofleriaceae bacterium]|nr:hypothetical protein [Kofleriaceae bacterium]